MSGSLAARIRALKLITLAHVRLFTLVALGAPLAPLAPHKDPHHLKLYASKIHHRQQRYTLRVFPSPLLCAI